MMKISLLVLALLGVSYPIASIYPPAGIMVDGLWRGMITGFVIAIIWWDLYGDK